jgi:type II secretory pathway pseudopilin PulG
MCISRSYVRCGAFTLVEVMIAASVGLMILGVLVSTSLSVQRNISATEHLAKASNDGNRVLDSIAQDLRRAVRVGTVTGGVHTTLKNNAKVELNNGTTLLINIPDYYGSNAANSPGFLGTRYPRSMLNTLPLFNGRSSAALDGSVPWQEAVMKIGSVETTRFAPASLGSGEVQVRYHRGPRSAQDGTLCFFRSEYQPGSSTAHFPPEEIAERLSARGEPLKITIAAPLLPVSDKGHGRIFTLVAVVQPRFSRRASTGSEHTQQLTVSLRNPRRD